MEICWNCGRSVALGSGNFVNRIPSLDTVEERRDNDCAFPEGEWLCPECECTFEEEHTQDMLHQGIWHKDVDGNIIDEFGETV